MKLSIKKIKPSRSSQKTSGFTVLEIAVCLVIVGIFSTMAIPLYRNFMVKTKMTELRGLGHGATLSIVDFMHENGRLPTNSSEVDFGIQGIPKYLQEITWEDDVLTLTANGDSLGLRTGEEIALVYQAVVREGTIAWSCKTVGPSQYAPEGCPTL